MLLLVFVRPVTHTSVSIVFYLGQTLVLLYTVEPSNKVFHDQSLESKCTILSVNHWKQRLYKPVNLYKRGLTCPFTEGNPHLVEVQLYQPYFSSQSQRLKWVEKGLLDHSL